MLEEISGGERVLSSLAYVKQKKGWFLRGRAAEHMQTGPYAEKIVRNCEEMDGEIRERGKFGWFEVFPYSFLQV